MSGTENAIASDLWLQVFSRLAEREDATLIDPTYDPAEDLNRARIAFSKAGWSDSEIQAFQARENERLAAAPITSPGVNPSAEMFLKVRCDEVELAMRKLGMNSHFKVARGVQPIAGPGAGLTNVIMTDESIVTVDAHTFRYCGVIAKAAARTINLWTSIWDSKHYDSESASKILRSAPRLMKYWIEIYISYALTGTNTLVEFLPAQKSELLVYEQIARAMEIFMIAHEYGHHHLAHGRTMENDAHMEEYAADQFALKICYELAKKRIAEIPDPYLSSGGGGILLLMSLASLRRVKAKLGLPISEQDTHPAASQRIERFESVAVLKPIEFQTLKGFRLACQRVMMLVDSEIVDSQEIDWPRLRELTNAYNAVLGGQLSQ